MVREEAIPVPPWRKQRKASAVRQQLSLDVIVDTALRVLDAEGLAAVTMRRVADELNTGPASLYAYVSNKDELLDLVYDRVVGEIEVPEPDPKRWREQLREIYISTLEVLGRHADIALVGLANLPTGPHALRVGEAYMAIMLAGGVPPQTAAWGMDAIGLYTVANAYERSLYLLRQKRSGKEAEEFFDEYFGQMREYYASLPAGRFPSLHKHLKEMFTGGEEERFLFGLDLMIDGLAGTVVRRPSRR
ncbi:MAG TPA: TetR/AcrR family transcriptional regulator [Candidatus Limnocylindrales bacterium]|nr:TetR/AcrR family transcriptional regulator [Candidatus Limnocylindrales bacterium]